MTSAQAGGMALRKRLLVALAIFFIVSGAVALTARDPGLTWDEAIYLGRALNYREWFVTLSSASFGHDAILKTWFQTDHPPLGCAYIAASIGMFGGGLDPVAAARTGAGILFGLAAVLIFFWASDRGRIAQGTCASAAFVLMPRVFAHGHFANLEMMTLLLWLATSFAFVKGIRSWKWSAACGLFFGLALLTKINGAFLPVFLAPWGLLFHGRRSLRNLICMAVIGPVVFFAGWPAMWVEPGAVLGEFIKNKTTRFLIPVYYLGTIYKEHIAPWHYPFVMLLATTPMLVLAGAAASIARWARGLKALWRERADTALLVWGLAFPVLLLALPGVPKYDGIRLMLTALPFLALLAGEGAVAVWAMLRTPLVKKLLPVIMGIWLVIPVIAFHPYQLCYYGEVAGGPWGAKHLGFETTYWGDTFDKKALAFLNDNVPGGKSVAFVAVGEFVWKWHQLLGEARADLRQGDFDSGDWDYLVVVPRQGWMNEKEREFVATHQPVWSNSLSPFNSPVICSIYEKPK